MKLITLNCCFELSTRCDCVKTLNSLNNLFIFLQLQLVPILGIGKMHEINLMTWIPGSYFKYYAFFFFCNWLLHSLLSCNKFYSKLFIFFLFVKTFCWLIWCCTKQPSPFGFKCTCSSSRHSCIIFIDKPFTHSYSSVKQNKAQVRGDERGFYSKDWGGCSMEYG